MRLSKQDQEKLWDLYRDYLRQEDDPARAFNWAMKRLNFFLTQPEEGDEAPSASQSSTKHSYWGE